MAAAFSIDRNRLLKRVQHITSAWTWQLDALLIVTGKTSDEACETKALAMHHYLLGIEFPETAVAILRSGTVVFFTSPKKIPHLEKVAGPGVHIVVRTAGGGDSETNEFLDRLKDGKAKARIALLLKEKHTGVWAPSFVSSCSSCDTIEVVECRDEISEILAVKDDNELQMCEKAAFFGQLFLQEVVISKIEYIVDKDLKQTNTQICDDLLAKIEDPDTISRWEKEYALDPQELELVYVSVQSGKEFDLKPAPVTNDDILPMQGSYVLSVGMKYGEYSACISRTLLVTPQAEQRDAYHLALQVFDLVLDCLKPGVPFKDVYEEAKKHVKKHRPLLLERFVRSVGFSMGLEFKDPQLVLSEKSERKVTPGMVLCVSVGFVDMGSKRPWAVWLADTVVIQPEGSEKACRPLTSSGKLYNEVVYELEELEPVVENTPVAATKEAGHTLPATAKATAKEKTQGRSKAGEKARTSAPDSKRAKTAKEQRSSSKKDKQNKKEEHRKSRADRSGVVMPTTTAAVEMLQKKRASRHHEVQKEMAAQIEMDQANVRLREAKLKELQERFADRNERREEDARQASKLHDCKAYSNSLKMPGATRPNRLHIDMEAEALLAPICGSLVPFHLRTIKNMSRQQSDNFQMLRVNFFTPGNGKTLEDYPMVNGQRVYVKELSYRSQVGENFDALMRTFKEMQKRSRQVAIEGEVRRGDERIGLGEAKIETLKSFPCLRDLYVRPSPGGRGRTTGTLEAHTNGFRFNIKAGADKLEVLYSRIQHIIFQPCEGATLIVIIHLHLKEPMLVGKRKTHDLQFFAECAPLSEDLSIRRAGNAHDPDEILEEEREREWKSRLNQIFLDFTKKVQGLSTFSLKFDMPWPEFQFSGVPARQSVMLFPCDRALVSLQEFPPFCLDLASIDIAVFERVQAGLREFDLSFVLKDYEQQVIRVTTIPSQRKDVLRKWLSKLGMPVYEVKLNMNWPHVMKDINSDIQAFLAEGGWDGLFGDDSEEEEYSDDENGEGDDYEPEQVSDSSGSEWAPTSSEEESDPGESEPSDGESWDELERKAERDDRKRDAEKLSKQSGKVPPGKKQRR